MRIGYARCSTILQDLDVQRAQLAELDVDRVYVDEGRSGGSTVNRPGLAEAMAAVRGAGDVLIVTKLDRLARSVPDARDIVQKLTDQGAALQIGSSVHDPNDPTGRLLLNALAMVAEFERDIIRARTREGMALARARGRLKGRQPKLTKKQQEKLVKLHDEGDSIQELAELFAVSRATVYRTIARVRETAKL